MRAMLFKLTPARDGAYILAIALLFTAKLLWPSVLMASATQETGKQWVFLCGSLQNQWIQLDAEQTPDGEEQAIAQDCPLCGLFKLQLSGFLPEETAIKSPITADISLSETAPLQLNYTPRYPSDLSLRAPPAA